MVIRVKEIKISLAGSTTTLADIGTLTTPEKHTYRIIEINPLLATSCEVAVQVENDEIARFTNDFASLDKRRRVVDWELPTGVTLAIKGINGDGSAHTIGLEITYEDK